VVKSTKVNINVKEVFILPAICAVVMVFAAIFSYSNIFDATGSNTLATTSSIAFGGVIYFLMLLITKTLSIEEMRNLIKK
jgi:stage V sporulation protein B